MGGCPSRAMLTANPGGLVIKVLFFFKKNIKAIFKSNSQFYVSLVVSVKLVYHDIAYPLKKKL